MEGGGVGVEGRGMVDGLLVSTLLFICRDIHGLKSWVCYARWRDWQEPTYELFGS